jgi:hypothetical protein
VVGVGGSAAFLRLWINTASPEKKAEAVVKVLEMHYDRGEMMRYAFGSLVVVMWRDFFLGVVSEVVF